MNLDSNLFRKTCQKLSLSLWLSSPFSLSLWLSSPFSLSLSLFLPSNECKCLLRVEAQCTWKTFKWETEPGKRGRKMSKVALLINIQNVSTFASLSHSLSLSSPSLCLSLSLNFVHPLIQSLFHPFFLDPNKYQDQNEGKKDKRKRKNMIWWFM